MKSFTSLILLMSLMSFSSAAADHIAHFTSDGCSAFPDGTIMDPEAWQGCCFTHDISYWMGGTAKEKDQADETFKQCVNSKKAGMGYITYAGVRMGGSPDYPTTWRWGYGWPEGRGYQRLSNAEKKMVADELDSLCFVGKEAGLLERYMDERKIPAPFSKMNRLLKGSPTAPTKRKTSWNSKYDKYRTNPFPG